MNELAAFAEKYKDQPTLAFTHFQPAQPTTVGKRATLWLMELKLDLDDLDYVIDSMRLLGSKGTTGTQASFLELFDGDHEKCRKADQMIADKMGFPGCYPVSGQTYSRKMDSRVLDRPGRHCPERPQVLQRHPPAPAPKRGGGAL